jgi:hypothetical protein
MQVFGHSGDLGDIIYSLPAIKALGGGRLILFDSPGKTAHGMNPAKVDRLRPLLEQQDYIESVEWSDVRVETNLNGFRDHHHHGNLADMHLATHGLEWRHRVSPWLFVDPKPVAKVVVQRSLRYGGNFPWREAVEVYGKDAVFVGFKDEHEEFCSKFGDIPHYDAKDFLELAQVIAGSEWFIGNQSSPLAVAHGLKHPVMMEICPGGAQQHCVYQRAGCIIVWDDKVEWPCV